jgi:hypothetical protein
MPAVQPSKSNLILVTGGSGYIASHVYVDSPQMLIIQTLILWV